MRPLLVLNRIVVLCVSANSQSPLLATEATTKYSIVVVKIFKFTITLVRLYRSNVVLKSSKGSRKMLNIESTVS